MFPATCRQFAHVTGKQTLIPSSSLLESTRTKPLSVVVKRKKRKWVAFSKMEYIVHSVKIQDLLLDHNVPDTNMETRRFCSYNSEKTFMVDAAFEVDVAHDVMEAKVDAYKEVTINARLGELLLIQVESPEHLISDLMTRQIDIRHPLVEEIRQDKDAVLCVIRSVIQTTEDAEITRMNHKDGNMKVSDKVVGAVSVEGGAGVTTIRELVIDKGVTIAYEVFELKINTKNGSILPIQSSNMNGGFSYMDGIDVLDGALPSTETGQTELRALEDKLQPLIILPEIKKQKFKTSLLDVLACPSDVELLSELLEKAETGRLDDSKDELNEEFIFREDVWNILELVGFEIENDVVVYRRDITPEFVAVSYVVDAVSEINCDDLEKLCKCDEKQIKVLFKILESAVMSNMPISLTEELDDHVTSLLAEMEFAIYNGNHTVLPPKTRTCVPECVFCISYCLS